MTHPLGRGAEEVLRVAGVVDDGVSGAGEADVSLGEGRRLAFQLRGACLNRLRDSRCTAKRGSVSGFGVGERANEAGIHKR